MTRPRDYLTTLSLLLAIAATVGWARTVCYWDRVQWTTAGLRHVELESDDGTLSLQYSPGYPRPMPLKWDTDRYPVTGWGLGSAIFGGEFVCHRGGVLFGGADTGRSTVCYRIGLPYWFLLALGCVAPVWRKCSRARRRRSQGLCARCGYDLRESRPLPGVRHGAGRGHRFRSALNPACSK